MKYAMLTMKMITEVNRPHLITQKWLMRRYIDLKLILDTAFAT